MTGLRPALRSMGSGFRSFYLFYPLLLATASCGVSTDGSFSLSNSAAPDACATLSNKNQPSSVPATLPRSNHIVMVMEENQSYSSVVGNTTDWPTLNSLIAQGALPTHYYANCHPSIPNYFMLATGQMLTVDDRSAKVWNVDNIARRMLRMGVPFKVYVEGITQGYLGGDTGLYVRACNPFAMLSDIADDPQVANQVLMPFTQFGTDVGNDNLPAFSFIVPDLDDEAHSGTPRQADDWLKVNVVSPLSSYPAFRTGGDGVLIVDFDESFDSDVTHGGGHVATVFWGPAVKAGYVQTSNTVYQHQSMLQTVMDELGLPNPPGAAATAPPMSEFFTEH